MKFKPTSVCYMPVPLEGELMLSNGVSVTTLLLCSSPISHHLFYILIYNTLVFTQVIQRSQHINIFYHIIKRRICLWASLFGFVLLNVVSTYFNLVSRQCLMLV